MSINIGDKPEMNVVNVGDEISTDQLAAITNAAAPTAANPFATIADVGGGGGGGNPFDQSLNTTDSVAFQGISNGDISATYQYNINVYGASFIDYTGVAVNIYPNWQAGEGGIYIDDFSGIGGSGLGVQSITNYGLKFQDGSIQTTAAGSATLNVVELDGAGIADQYVDAKTYAYVTATDTVTISLNNFANIGDVAYIASTPDSGANICGLNGPALNSTLVGFNFPIGATLEITAGQVAKVIRVNDADGSEVYHAFLVATF